MSSSRCTAPCQEMKLLIPTLAGREKRRRKKEAQLSTPTPRSNFLSQPFVCNLASPVHARATVRSGSFNLAGRPAVTRVGSLHATRTRASHFAIQTCKSRVRDTEGDGRHLQSCWRVDVTHAASKLASFYNGQISLLQNLAGALSHSLDTTNVRTHTHAPFLDTTARARTNM